jgi:hypothetical protein
VIEEWVQSGVEMAGVSAIAISEPQVNDLLSAIERRFTGTEPTGLELWERFHCDVSQMRSDGWRMICGYAWDRPILLFKDGDRFHGYQFNSGVDLLAVLTNSPGFEFYVTNDDPSFVLCHNHHDYVIGVGACQPWLLNWPDPAG